MRGKEKDKKIIIMKRKPNEDGKTLLQRRGLSIDEHRAIIKQLVEIYGSEKKLGELIEELKEVQKYE